MIIQQVEIINKLGLHARAAAKFVTLASSFSSEIYLSKENTRVNGKSIMGVMMLAASRGSRLDLAAHGLDQEQAIETLCALVSNRFDEES